MGLYRPLAITALLEGNPIPECRGLSTMKMNLLASSSDEPRIVFIGCGSHVMVYHFSTLTPSGLPTLVKQLSNPRRTDDEFIDRTINVLKVGRLGTEEVLVSADEQGDVCVWFTMNLQRDPLLLSVTDSAWGIDINAEHRLIAVSSNAHNVTVFHCGIDSRLTQRLMEGDMDESSGDDQSLSAPSTTEATISPSRTVPQPIDRTSQQILRGHGHNIPTVTFSPCGNFVATASVDRTCRTWRLSDGKQIQEKSLGNLWGWGVCFVDEDAWITITRAEYKAIPKDHLRPGKLPGQNVRDDPLSTTPYLQRRLPPGNDFFRMIRTRWYAGPLNGTSCDEQDSDDDAQKAGVLENDHDELDDRDAALFGMDDDDGEDEWEDMSSSDVDDTEEEEGAMDQDQQREQRAQEGESTVDTGDDGDDELIGAETEDGGGTTEDNVGEAYKRKRPAEALEVPDLGGSSSEYEQFSQQSSSRSNPPTELDSSAIVDNDTTDNEQEARNKDISDTIEMEQQVVVINSVSLPLRYSVPRFPRELLLCATSRNIYLLGENSSRSVAHEKESDNGVSRTAPNSNTTLDQDQTMAGDEDEDEDESEDEGGGEDVDSEDSADEFLAYIESHGGDMELYAETGSQSDSGGEEFTMDEVFDETESEDEDDDDDDDDDDEGHSYGMSGTSRPRTHPLSTDYNKTHNSQGIPLLQTLSVARAAAARADGRRVRHLDHFDRLFVMQLVPELGVLVAASQKGSVTVFRLLKVLDDPPPTNVANNGLKQGSNAQGHETTDPKSSTKTTGSTSRSNDEEAAANANGIEVEDTVTIGGAKFVLFPEYYLPRLETHGFPLLGVSISPLRPRPPPPVDQEREPERLSATLPARTPSMLGSLSTAGRPLAANTSSSSSSSFILHLAYLDSQMYSYEIRIRNERDDPVGLSSVFV
ncbi:hypothetical protein EMPS_07034 [Entomortierella parvispora]|uniref:WD40 repeat-like protein n=1 Tax=Entomortierella parvispora TaxID=205924 RepID=A0A9P3HDB8_9FUNG|nr:hypothetical protein EMPS_07034 [Entomortierella parvispora]